MSVKRIALRKFTSCIIDLMADIQLLSVSILRPHANSRALPQVWRLITGKRWRPSASGPPGRPLPSCPPPSPRPRPSPPSPTRISPLSPPTTTHLSPRSPRLRPQPPTPPPLLPRPHPRRPRRPRCLPSPVRAVQRSHPRPHPRATNHRPRLRSVERFVRRGSASEKGRRARCRPARRGSSLPPPSRPGTQAHALKPTPFAGTKRPFSASGGARAGTRCCILSTPNP